MQKRLLESSDSLSRDSLKDEANSPSLDLIQGGRTNYGAKINPTRISLEDLQSFGADWLNDAQCMRQSPSTIAGKKETIARLVWYLQKIGAPGFGPRELQKFVRYISVGHEEPGGRWGNPALVNPASDRTVQYYFNYVRGFCRWMIADPYIPLDIDLSHGVRVVKPKPEPIQPFSMSQIAALLDTAHHSQHPRRDEAILLFMLDTGVRASELCSLKWGEVQMHTGYGQAKVLGKGRKERVVPFSRLAARALWKYVAESPRTPQSPVFQADRGKDGAGAALTRYGLLQLYERLGKAAHLQGVRCSPHTMRHTFAINFLRNGGNTFTLQAILGHDDLKMTQRYCKIAQADIQDQHSQFSPADGLMQKK